MYTLLPFAIILVPWLFSNGGLHYLSIGLTYLEWTTPHGVLILEPQFYNPLSFTILPADHYKKLRYLIPPPQSTLRAHVNIAPLAK
jgi:hypothetical protein